METVSNTTFSWGGSMYDIRVLVNDRGITIAVFANHYPATGLRYQIQVPSHADPKKIAASEAFTEFLDHARDDIRNSRWDRMLAEK